MDRVVGRRQSTRAWRGLGLVLALAAAGLLGLVLSASVAITTWAAPAAPPTFTVNSGSDVVAAGPLNDGVCATVFPYVPPLTCTLRAAIMKANHYPGGGVTIHFDPQQTNGSPILLTIHPAFNNDDETLGDLNISQTTHIVGNGAGLTIIDAQSAQDRAFWIEPGAVVDMSGVTIQNGFEGQYGGGGLYVNSGGALTLDRSAVLSNTDNSGLGGGGIMAFGVLTVTHSLLYNNFTAGGGGGAAIGSSATVAASSVISNLANTGDGGGLNNFGALLNLVDSTVASNTVSAHDGGGVVGEHGQTNIVNSTISGNKTHGSGGGVASLFLGTEVSLFNTTVADNRADVDLVGGGAGGGLSAASSGAIHLQNSLIADNYGSLHFPSSWLEFRDDCFGPLDSQGYNLLTWVPSTCSLTLIAGDQVTTTDHLGPLQANGGPTLTQALLPGSPAIDAGNTGGCRDQFGARLAADQRGYPRTANGAGIFRCDIGAFEVQRIVSLPLVLR